MASLIRIGVMTAPRAIEVREVPKPHPGEDEVLVRIEACAICTTEQRLYTGTQKWNRFPYVGGHEAAGVVDAVGPGVVEVKAGDHVAVFSATCGVCDNCRRGRTNRCLHREGFWDHAGLWGTWGFSEYKVVRPRGLQVIAPQVPFEHAALAEPLACVVHGARRSAVSLGDEVVVVGAGTMGLLNGLVFRALGAAVTVLDLQKERCQKAVDAGITRAFVPDDSTVERIDALTGGHGPDLVVVAAGSKPAYDLGRSLLGHRARLLAFASIYPDSQMTIDMTDLHRTEKELFGAVSSDIADMMVTGKVLSKRLVDVSPAVDRVLPLVEIGKAMDLAIRPDTYRIVLRMHT